MAHHRSTRLRHSAVWAGIVVAGVFAGWAGYRGRADELRETLRRDAGRLAAGLGGGLADAGLSARLHHLRSLYPEVHYLGVYRLVPGAGRAVILGQAAAGGAPAEDRLVDPDRSPGLAEAARLGEVALGPWRVDGSERRVTAYAPVLATRAGGGPPGHDVVVVDADATGWLPAMANAAFQAAFYTWVLLGLPFLAFLVSRRQGEQREVIRNLSEAMEQSHSAIMIVDLQGQVEYANRGLCQQLGYARRELLGRDWRQLGLAPTPEAAHAELMVIVRAGHPWEGEWTIQRKDAGMYPARGVVTPVKNRDGSLACYIVSLDDVTEAKRREAELREARDHARAGDRAKGQFLATMSHEVRTPLNGIVGFTSLLLETPLTAEQRDYVQTIRMSTEALIQLTGDILDFARVESGKLKLELLPCDPRECIEDALDLMAAKAAEKQIELLHHSGPDVPAAVLTDGGRLRQVLVNLVGNAVKFTEQGEVEVGVRLLPPDSPEAPAAADRGSPGAALEFSVRDTGIGIAPHQHPMLFKPFSQVDDSTTRRYSGTGLGLAISRNLVRLMGGDIAVVSEPGRGSLFRFTICAPMAAPQPPNRDLAGERVALVAPPGALRRQLAGLLDLWRAGVIEVGSTQELDCSDWQAAIVDLDERRARQFAAISEPVPGIMPDKAIGLVPVTLSSELRAALRTHFRSLLNKPVHHEALFSLLSAARSGAATIGVLPVHFGFRVLLVDNDPINQRVTQRVLARLGCSWKAVDDGRAALVELSAHPDDYDLVLVDLPGPEHAGLAAWRELRDGAAGSHAQTIWIIAVTTDAGDEQRARAHAVGLNDSLAKPLTLSDVEAAFKRFRSERTSRQR